MDTDWTEILNKYINKLVSPDGRQTYESKNELVNFMIDLMDIQSNDRIIDIGSGWGNFLIKASNSSENVIGIEPNLDNLNEAKKRSVGKNIKYIQGSFEKLNFSQKADKAISMLAFHQVPWDDKVKALKNVSDIIDDNGYFYLCDTLILFNPDEDTKLFDKVYRYLLKETTPDEIYKNYIEPYIDDSEVYTIDDMKENSPKDNWFYSIEDVKKCIKDTNLKIIKVAELCPFFGVVIFQKS